MDENGARWLPDQEYGTNVRYGASGGGIVSRDFDTIEGTPAPGVYLTERWGLTGYRFDLPDGNYTVRLHFAETHGDDYRAGTRIFDVAIGGKTVLPDFNPFGAAGGFAQPVVKESKGIEVSDRKLLIEFTEKLNHSEINGIEVLGE